MASRCPSLQLVDQATTHVLCLLYADYLGGIHYLRQATTTCASCSTSNLYHVLFAAWRAHQEGGHIRGHLQPAAPAVAQIPTDMFIPGQSSLVFCFSLALCWHVYSLLFFSLPACLLHAERTKKEIISEGTYNQMFQLLHKLLSSCRHVMVLLTVPIVFPGTAFHPAQAVPFSIPCTAFHYVQAMPFTTPTHCLSSCPGIACHGTQGLPFIVSMLPFTVSMLPFIALACLPLSCLLPLSRTHWRVLPYTCFPHLHAHT